MSTTRRLRVLSCHHLQMAPSLASSSTATSRPSCSRCRASVSGRACPQIPSPFGDGGVDVALPSAPVVAERREEGLRSRASNRSGYVAKCEKTEAKGTLKGSYIQQGPGSSQRVLASQVRTSRATDKCMRPVLVDWQCVRLVGESRTENPIPSMISIDRPTRTYNHLGYCF